jgi:hypothetical protein
MKSPSSKEADSLGDLVPELFANEQMRANIENFYRNSRVRCSLADRKPVFDGTDLRSMLIQGIFEHWDHFKICKNDGCAAPFYVAKRTDQLVCSSESCKSEKQREYAREWWGRNMAKAEVSKKTRKEGELLVALAKRRKTLHTHFFVDGQRFRQSLETSDWREAQRKERILIGDAEAGKLAASSDDFSRLLFRAAAERFLADRIAYLRRAVFRLSARE